MRKNYTNAEARQLLTEIKELLEHLEYGSLAEQRCRELVELAADNCVSKELNKVLESVPIEEVNRNKHGIRTKALRECGFNSLADIMPSTIEELEAVRGISNDGAHLIKIIANELAATARKDVKIRLSLDDTSSQCAELMTALFKYQQAVPCANRCEELLNEHAEAITAACDELQAGTGLFKWLFAPSDIKQRSQRAFSTLYDYCFCEFGSTAKDLLTQLSTLDLLTADDARKEFSRNPVRMVNTLESLVPGLIGSDDSVYGLPEELADELSSEEYSLEGLKCELRKYQEWGVKFILHQKRVLLGDEMGLGKTIQAIAAMTALYNAGNTHFLVVCPAAVLSNWCREIQKMSELPVIRVHGVQRGTALKMWQRNGGVAVTTFETTGIIAGDEELKLALMVVDEAHYVKNPEALRTINIVRLSRYAERLLFMTGTALENRVDEMTGLIRILRPDIADYIRGMESLSSAPEFRRRVAPVYYRRKREDVLTELPELVENREWCTMTPLEEAIYDLAILQRRYSDARRVSWNVPDIGQSSKARRLLELIAEAEADGRKLIVFSFFLDTLRKVCKLPGINVIGPITGSVPPEQRQKLIDSFDSAPAGTVLAAQIQSGGTGLNIQSASVVVLCEPQFKPSIENQAISRAYRMGQTRTVFVYRLLCDDTIDESITELLESKQQIFDAFADESEAALKDAEIDENTLSSIISGETQRIAEKHGAEPTAEFSQEELDGIINNINELLKDMENKKNSVLDIHDFM